jgi:hypothetical protein
MLWPGVREMNWLFERIALENAFSRDSITNRNEVHVVVFFPVGTRAGCRDCEDFIP